MRQVPRVQVIMRRGLGPVLVAVLAAGAAPAASPGTQNEAVNPLAASMYEFQQPLEGYFKLREQM